MITVSNSSIEDIVRDKLLQARDWAEKNPQKALFAICGLGMFIVAVTGPIEKEEDV